MLKRWNALPRNVQWLIGAFAGVVLAVAVVWVLFVPVTDSLAHHDVGSARAPSLQTARDAARGRFLTLGAGLFAAGALVFTARNFTLSRRTVELTRRTFELTEQGQVTDRYTKAIEQLGSDKLDVRIGGIYALERVARDSARDHPTVMEVLIAFIREHSHDQSPPPDPVGREQERSIRADVQAAVTVVGRRDAERDTQRIDLTRADLTGANLDGADLTGADLRGVILTHASLYPAILNPADRTRASLDPADFARAITGYALDGRLPPEALRLADRHGVILHPVDLLPADLRPADLTRSLMHGADLTSATLAFAVLTGADLTGATLTGTVLTNATLRAATLTGAKLAGANLAAADLTRAVLTSAVLTSANLAAADLTGAVLTSADLTGARWPEDAPLPEGWKLDASSGRLERAGTDSGPAEAN